MFSGIKSILFGYSEPDNSVNNELISEAAGSESEPASASSSSSSSSSNALASSSSCNKTTSRTSEKSLGSDTSALLEQTLTAATTKFTEQLLLPSPSIEQLQSSSRQLLPTLTEQHEEETLKRNRESQLLVDGANGPAEQDDECLDEDSWEMLDLVEKPQSSSLNSTVQQDSGDRSSGILKQAGRDPVPSQHPKPKVSFETSDLVSEKKKIEPATKPRENTKPGSSRSRNKKKSKQTKVIAQLQIAGEPTIEKDSDRSGPVKESPPDQDVEVVETETETAQNSPKQTIAISKLGNGKLPILNYAAALHKKKDGGEQSKVNDSKPVEGSARPSPATGGHIVGVPTAGPSKRNRPVSSSSWSSSDETEAVDSLWNCGDEESKQGDTFEKFDEETGLADQESLVSSGFSESDFGYGDLNDFYLRPRKNQNKRRGVSANSSSLLTSISKRGCDRDLNRKQPDGSSASSVCPKVTITKGKIDSFKNMKPKRKKMVMTPSTRSDFLKQCHTGTGLAPASNSERPKAKIESPFVKPIAPSAVSTNNSGNDSSDLADMDESWYVTPPPCFTGANTLSTAQPKPREAARENALIEHPVVYIASGCKQQAAVTSSAKPQASAIPAAPKAIVLKKVNKEGLAVWSCKKSSSKKEPALGSASQPRSTKEQKAWDNKFIVDVWDEEQDDLDDFDNLFESARAPSSGGKSKKLPKARKNSNETKLVQPKVADDEPTACMETISQISPPSSADISEESSIEVIMPEELEPQVNNENYVPATTLESTDAAKKPMRERRAVVQVRPIEPERQPGWQLRKRRSKRRALATNQVNHVRRPGKLAKDYQAEQSEPLSATASSSARSTPTLIDRIGSSIVANLTNLTNGFPGGSIQMPPRAAIEEVDKFNQSVSRGPADEAKLVARRRLSRNCMNRQNDCAKLGNSNRRTDRRVKMFSTINGVSVNRKVHTSFH